MVASARKTITGYIPNDLDMQFVESRRFGIQATVPSLKTSASSKAKACYNKSFRVKAAQQWNLLASTTKDLDSLDKFKISLSTFLRRFPDKPPSLATLQPTITLYWTGLTRVEGCR